VGAIVSTLNDWIIHEQARFPALVDECDASGSYWLLIQPVFAFRHRQLWVQSV
jgi:hypothetical protein